jgi:hypothetical protein
VPSQSEHGYKTPQGKANEPRKNRLHLHIENWPPSHFMRGQPFDLIDLIRMDCPGRGIHREFCCFPRRQGGTRERCVQQATTRIIKITVANAARPLSIRWDQTGQTARWMDR